MRSSPPGAVWVRHQAQESAIKSYHVHWVRVCICVASSGPPGDVWVQHQAQASEMKSFMCIGSGSLLFLSLFICDQVASCVFGQGLHMRCILCNLVRVRIRKIYDAGSCRDCY